MKSCSSRVEEKVLVVFWVLCVAGYWGLATVSGGTADLGWEWRFGMGLEVWGGIGDLGFYCGSIQDPAVQPHPVSFPFPSPPHENLELGFVEAAALTLNRSKCDHS